MFGLFAKQPPIKSVSAAERTAMIARIVARLGSQYSGLKQYRGL